MELRGRLGAIADRIPKCNILADIGTDHAYIPLYAIMKSICRKAVAADVKKGPVEIAKRNIKRYGLEDRIESRLGSGLEPLGENEAEVIVIAGMGGVLIQEILANRIQTARNARLLILQPMNMLEVLRKWLNDNGFEICDETLAEETGKIYNILIVKWTGNTEQLSNFHCYIGKGLVNRKDSLFKRYAENKLKLLNVRIEGMQKALTQQEGLKELIDIKSELEDTIKAINMETR